MWRAVNKLAAIHKLALYARNSDNMGTSPANICLCKVLSQKITTFTLNMIIRYLVTTFLLNTDVFIC